MRTFVIVEPPTGEEVRVRTLVALINRDQLVVSVRADHQVPRAENFELRLYVSETSHPDDGGMRVIGASADGSIVSITVETETDSPAHGEIVDIR